MTQIINRVRGDSPQMMTHMCQRERMPNTLSVSLIQEGDFLEGDFLGASAQAAE